MSNISVKLIDVMGSDKRVAHTARQSFAKQDYEDAELNIRDETLIKFLATGYTSAERKELMQSLTKRLSLGEASEVADSIRNHATHWTPFAHCMVTVQCTAPVPIARQAFKHKVGFVENEESRRYIQSTPEIFQPDYFRPVAKTVKQGSEDAPSKNQEKAQQIYHETTKAAVEAYEKLLSMQICPEQARFVLPQGAMVNWTWTGSLYSFAQFYAKRTDTHAQKEIQELAIKIGKLIEKEFPHSWKALTQFGELLNEV